MARLVVVAKFSSELPSKVVEPKRFDAVELKAPDMVVEPVTASEPVVVPLKSEKFSPTMSPVFDMEKRVVVETSLVEEEMLKSVVVAEEEAENRESSPYGVEVPMPKPFETATVAS